MSNISLISPLSVFHGTKTSHISQLKKHTFSYQSTQPKQNCSMHDSEASQGVMGLRCNERWVLKKQDKEGLQKSTYTQWHNAQGRQLLFSVFNTSQNSFSRNCASPSAYSTKLLFFWKAFWLPCFFFFFFWFSSLAWVRTTAHFNWSRIWIRVSLLLKKNCLMYPFLTPPCF